MNKISILNFINGYKKAADKELYVKNHIVTTYVPYEEKVARANRIIKATSYIAVGDEKNQKKIPKISSTSRYMYFMIELIAAYTDINIEYADGKALESFNELNKNGMFEVIIPLLPGKEYTEFEAVLNMLLDDLFENERTVYSLLNQKLEAIGVLLEGFIPVLDKALANEKVIDTVVNMLDKMSK